MLLLAAMLAAPVTVSVAPDYSLDHATWWLVGVTAALVICTLLTVWDGWRKGKLQEARWNFEDTKQVERWLAEDKQREEDAKPKTFVELATYENAPFRLVFIVYNLGNRSFLIDKLVIKVESKRTTIYRGTWDAEISLRDRFAATSDIAGDTKKQCLVFSWRESYFRGHLYRP